jgi:hypothetical protein
MIDIYIVIISVNQIVQNFLQHFIRLRWLQTVLYNTVQYSTMVADSNVLYSTVLYCTVLYCTVLYSTVQYDGCRLIPESWQDTWVQSGKVNRYSNNSHVL